MRGEVSCQTRRELLQHIIPQYRKASSVKKKSKLLVACTAKIGYNRTYAMWLLNHAERVAYRLGLIDIGHYPSL